MDQNNRGETLLSGIRNTLLTDIDREIKRLKICLISTFLIGLIAHGWGMMHLIVSQDSLSEFYWSNSKGWKFVLGRFAEPVLRYIMGEIIVLPWLTGLSGLLFASFAVYLISKMFSLNRVWENVLLSGICISNAAMTTLIATYIHDFAGDMLALFLSVLAAYQWVQMRDRLSWKHTLVGGACLAVCFGLYQAYLAVTLTLICIYAIMDLLQGRTVGKTIAGLVRAIPMGVLSLAAYGLCVLVVVYATATELGGNGGNDMTQVGNNLLYITDLVKQGYYQVMWEFFVPHCTSVKALLDKTTRVICFINIVLGLASAAIIVRFFRKKKMKWPEILVTLALIALLPLCMSCVSVVSTVWHYLMRYANYLFYLMVLTLFRLEREEASERMVKWQQLAAMGMMGIIILSNVQVANTAYEKKDFERDATLATMTRVLDRLEAYEDYEFGESEVAIAGIITSHQERLKVGNVDYMIGMGPTSQISYNGLEERYLEVVMGYPMKMCSPEKEAEIMETDQFKAMGSFPARDCIATIDGVVVVKLSDLNY